MKHIKKSIVLATALFVTTGLNADSKNYECSKSKNFKENNYKKDNRYSNKDKQMRRSHKGDISRFFIGAVYNLNLTKEQTIKIDDILKKFKNQKFDKFNGFTKNGFDKQAYIDARMKMKKQKLKLKANLIESIYKLLEEEQIKELNKKIEMFKERQISREKNDSHCNDRR